jgi:hypothetical protein
MLFSRLLEEGVEHGGTEYAWLVWVALAIFVVMVFLGWLVSSKGWLKQEDETVGGHDDHGHGHEEMHQELVINHDEQAKPDDLKSLEGIGPKVAKLLNENGIHTFSQLAAADAAKLKEVLDAAGYAYMDPQGWIEQAHLAAKGDAAGLQKLQDELKGGRRMA